MPETEAKVVVVEDASASAAQKLLYMIVGPVVLLFSLIQAYTLWQAQKDNEDQDNRFISFAYCQAQYNETSKAVSDIRAELAKQDRENTKQLNKDVGKIVANGKGDINKAFADYNQRLAEIESKRADNPLPAYPQCYDMYIREDVNTPPTGGPE